MDRCKDTARLLMALSVELTKPPLICDARPLTQLFRHFHFPADKVPRVTNIAFKGCYMTFLEDTSSFNYIFI